MSRLQLPLKQRLDLELHRAIKRQQTEEHELHQLFWECTLRCNLSCRHCGSDCRTLSEQPDMPLEDFVKVLDDIALHTAPSNIMVITTGGEPTMRNDLALCGKTITERGFVWGMVTNGMLLSESRLQSFLDSGLKSLAISFDGFEDDHNWMRGNPHCFRHALEAIQLLTRTENLTWDVITCVNQRTIKYLPQLRDYLISLNVPKWRLFSIFPSGRAKDDPELNLSPSQFVEMMEFIKQTRQEGRINLSYSCDGFLGKYEGEVRDKFFFCAAGINVASVLADGSISGCLSIRSNYHQGNIYQDSFWEIWQNRFQPYRNREWMKTDDCQQCEAWRFCHGNGFHLRDENGKLQLCQFHLIKK